MTSRPKYLRITLTAAAVVTGATLFVSGYWVGSAGGGAREPVATGPSPVPDWFLDIADYYDRNPDVTPDFDFALLYDSRPSAYRTHREPTRRRSGASAATPARISQTSIAGAKLGLSASAYKKLLGTPSRYDVPPRGFQDPENYTRLVFSKRKVAVYFKDGVDRGVEITTWNKAHKTAAGVGPCSSVAELKAAHSNAVKPHRWSTQNGNSYAYTLGKNIILASNDLVTVSAVAIFSASAIGERASAYAGFIAQNPDTPSCS